MESMLLVAMIQLNEIDFLITNEKNIIMKIKFNEKTLKFDSYNILLKKNDFLDSLFININNNCFITNFSPHVDNFDDSTLLVFQYLNN